MKKKNFGKIFLNHSKCTVIPAKIKRKGHEYTLN